MRRNHAHQLVRIGSTVDLTLATVGDGERGVGEHAGARVRVPIVLVGFAQVVFAGQCSVDFFARKGLKRVEIGRATPSSKNRNALELPQP